MTIAKCRSFLSLVLAISLPAAALHLGHADACMVLSGAGSRGPVRTLGEDVLVVWDEANQREHLIRSIAFGDASKPFGFVVPTPTRPELAEHTDALFRELELTYSFVPEPRGHSFGRAGARASAGAAPRSAAVTVVAREHVAGMEAIILRAASASELTQWLTRHHFEAPEGMTNYLAPYVRDGWYLTAFRYVPRRGNSRLRSSVVRMSFSTPRPFFPYSEPARPASGRARSFRLTVIANHRMDAFEGDTAWDVAPGYASPWVSLHEGLLRALRGVPVPSSPAWITTFHEAVSDRGQHDLWFRHASTDERVRSTLVRGTRPSARIIETRATPRRTNVANPWEDF